MVAGEPRLIPQMGLVRKAASNHACNVEVFEMLG